MVAIAARLLWAFSFSCRIRLWVAWRLDRLLESRGVSEGKGRMREDPPHEFKSTAELPCPYNSGSPKKGKEKSKTELVRDPELIFLPYKRHVM